MIKKRAIFLIVLLVVVMSSESANAQSHDVGIRGGYSMGLANFEPKEETMLDMGNYEMALTYTYTGFQEYYGALQAELIYSQRGFAYAMEENSPQIYTRKIRSVEIPFLWRPYYTFSKDRGIVYGLLGIYAYYDISSNIIQKNGEDPNDDFNMSEDWEYNTLRDNQLGVGVIGGIGFGWNVSKNLRLTAEARYAYAFSNVLAPASDFVGNPVQSTTSKIIISMGLTYSIKTKKK